MTTQLRLDGIKQLTLEEPKPFALEPYHYACKCGKAWAVVGVPVTDSVAEPLCEKCAAKAQR